MIEPENAGDGSWVGHATAFNNDIVQPPTTTSTTITATIVSLFQEWFEGRDQVILDSAADASIW